MDIGKYFGNALRMLRRRPALMLPSIGLSVTGILLVFIFLAVSGLLVPAIQYIQFSQAVEDARWSALTQGDFQALDDEQLLLQAQGQSGLDITNIVDSAFTQQTALMAVVFAVLICVSSLFFSCMHYVVIASAIRKKQIRLGSILSWTSWSIIRFVSAKFLIGIIYVTPMALLILVGFLVAKVSRIAAILLAFIGVFILLAYMFYIWLKFLFVIPDLFLHDRKPMIALNKSFTKTRGFMLQVFVVGLIQAILSYVANAVSGSWAILPLPAVIVLFLAISVLVYAALFTIKDLFMFYAWEDQKNWVQ